VLKVSWIINKDEWSKWYTHIKSKLRVTFARDQEATDLLSRMLENKNTITFGNLQDTFSEFEHAIVVGAGPSLEKSDKIVRNLGKSVLLISADGATSFLIENNVIPHVIVTDLDGKVQDILYANEKGSITIIHGHGDNIEALKKYVRLFKGKIMGSTQVEPRPFVYNFGGFTDGDRGVFLAAFLNIKNILLIGMDFGNIIGKYSKPGLKSSQPASEIKCEKLKIAKELINWITSKLKLNIKHIK